MVLLLAEWAAAAIPAVIILYIAAVAVSMALDAALGPALVALVDGAISVRHFRSAVRASGGRCLDGPRYFDLAAN
jgi:hypothetical protein